MNEKSVKSFENGKQIALIFGGIVYAGVVLLFLAFYQNLMAAQFEGFLKVVATIGAVLVALNALALPVALHFWALKGAHRTVAVIFYGVDIIVMTLNVLASAGLHSTVTPAWVSQYSSYAPASIVLTLAGWAILYMTDPGQRALIELAETLVDAQVQIVNRATEWLGGEEGIETVIKPVAAKLAARIFNEHRLIGAARALPKAEDDTVTEAERIDMAKLADEIVTAVKQKAGVEEAGQPVPPFGKNGKQHG